jgi:hypothetical protein
MNKAKISSSIPWLITGFLTLLVFIQTCHYRAEIDKQGKEITSLDLKNQTLEKEVNDRGQIIYSQKAILSSSQEAIRNLTDSIFNLNRVHGEKIKAVIAYYKGVTTTNIDSVFIPYTDTKAIHEAEMKIIERCNKEFKYLTDSFILVPRKVIKKTPNYLFAGTVMKDGFRIDELSIPDTLNLRFVETGGFLKKKKSYIQFTHSNPLITTTQANSVLYKPPKKPRLLEKALFIGAGLFLGSKLK